MKLVANIKLLPTPEQADALKETLERCNSACNWLSDQAWQNKAFRQFDLHKLAYHPARDRFGLAAQVAVRCIAKVADAYKLDTKSKRIFRPHSAQPYDDRIFRFLSDDLLSIWTLGGRQKIAYVCGDHQRRLLTLRKGEVDLMLVRGRWYLAVVCDIDDPDLIEITDVLGVDVGIVNIATDSDGTNHSGAAVERARRIHFHRRRNLQRKGTRSAKRKLRRLSGRQARYQRDVNHRISKAIVSSAQRSGRAVALEDLKGIRHRVKAPRRQRARLANWQFHQLRAFIEYKARLAGVPVLLIDPAHTSQTCPVCGRIDRKNRPDRDTFRCVGCGHAGPADAIAATNIRSKGRLLVARAVVNQPMVAELRHVA